MPFRRLAALLLTLFLALPTGLRAQESALPQLYRALLAFTVRLDDGEAQRLRNAVLYSMVDDGLADEALAAMERIEGPADRAAAMAFAAGAFLRNDAEGKALQLAEQALAIAEGLAPNRQRDRTISQIASVLAATGDPARAYELVLGLGDTLERSIGLAGLAPDLVGTGLLPEALATLRGLDVSTGTTTPPEAAANWHRASVIRMIAPLVADGDTATAREIAEGITDEGDRSQAFDALGGALFEAGDIEGGREFFGSAWTGNEAAYSLSYIIPGLLDIGETDTAFAYFEDFIDALEETDGGYLPAQALVQPLARMIALGDTAPRGLADRAIATIVEGASDYQRTTVLPQLAVALTEAGRAEEADELFILAVEAIQHAGASQDQINRLGDVATGLAQAGQTLYARELAERMYGPLGVLRSDTLATSRARALITIAETMAAIGRPEAAVEAITEALAMTQALPDAGDRFSIAMSIRHALWSMDL